MSPTARRDATAPRDAPAPAAPAPTRFPRLSRITNSMGCVRLICVLETLIVALCLLEAHTRCGERSLGCCVSSKWCGPDAPRRATAARADAANVTKIRSGASLPRLLVLGCVKCGGAALFDALNRHADFVGRSSNFFDVRWDDDRHAALGDDEARCRAYESLFSKLTARRGAYDVAVDATATYFRDPRAAPRVRRCFDDGALARTTLLAVLRDPAARLYSEYAVIRSRQPDRFGNATFARAVDGWLSDRGDAEGRRLLAVGHYVDQLLAWHQHLPREALYVVPAAALDDDATHVREIARRVLTRARVSAHLHNVSAPPRRPPGEAATYARRTGDAMDDATRRRLAAYYAPHDARLWAHLADHRDLVIPRAFQVAPGDPTTHWW